MEKPIIERSPGDRLPPPAVPGGEEKHSVGDAMAGIGIVFLLVNAVVLFCVFNPWIDRWRSQGYVVLIAELVLLVVVCVPVFLHHLLRKKKSFRDSITDTLRTLLDFLSGWA